MSQTLKRTDRQRHSQVPVRKRPGPLSAVPQRERWMPASAPLEPQERLNWRVTLVLVGVVTLFAASVLQFATLQWNVVPAAQRLNNGSEPTFFAFHIGPYYAFSEDFHLYYVRAARIARRGWNDALLYSRSDARPSFSAPIQVALSRLALLAEGRPLPYAVFMFATLAVAWSVLFLAARAWLPRDLSSASIVGAVLVTVICQSLFLAFEPLSPDTYQRLPVLRSLRMSTMAWTNPLLVAVLLGLSSLVGCRRVRSATLAAIGVMLVLLLGTDNWAFAMAWFAGGLVAAWLVATAVLEKKRTGGWPSASAKLIFGLSAILLVSFGVHAALNGAIEGDVLLRGGFGPPWRGTGDPYNTAPPMIGWLGRFALLPVGLALLLTYVEPRPTARAAPSPQLSEATWLRFRWLVLFPLAAGLLMSLVLPLKGMEPYLRNQIYWRLEYCFLFALAITAAEWLRIALPMLLRRAVSWPLVAGVALVALFTYHNYRVHWFVENVARRDFFLTADAEGLVDWLKEFDRRHDRYEIATASVELNYLAAFWTNADLLLPSGFPYHEGASNEEIERRAAQLMRLYGADEEAWLEFTEPTPFSFQRLWQTSRVAAEARGYLYHLFHRWTYLMRPDEKDWFEQGRREIAAALEDRDDDLDTPRPHVVLVDNVSRALGNPALAGYRLAHRSGAIEAWVRNDVSLFAQANLPRRIR